MTRLCIAKNAKRISYLQSLSKSSLLKKGLRMNPVVALSVVQLEKQKTEAKVAAASVVADFPVDHAKCFQLFAPLAEKTPRFLSDRRVTNQFIAVSVLFLNHVTTIRSFNLKTFPGISLERSFVFVK